MRRIFTLEDLQKQFEIARGRLSFIRADILCATPLPPDFSHELYSFSYLRAERLGLAAISNSLNRISWLPMHLEPEAEITLTNKAAMKRWLSQKPRNQPDNEDFGNDFIHALTRVALVKGWEGPEFRTTSLRIGDLFHDLSCLIGLIYYGVWMAENGISGVLISNPDDLERTAKEISDITQSPEVAALLAEKKQEHVVKKPKKRPNHGLHLINCNDTDGTSPAPP